MATSAAIKATDLSFIWGGLVLLFDKSCPAVDGFVFLPCVYIAYPCHDTYRVNGVFKFVRL